MLRFLESKGFLQADKIAKIARVTAIRVMTTRATINNRFKLPIKKAYGGVSLEYLGLNQ
ncbi:hypothetical protein GJV03_17665 [Acinetobacter sp. RIT698]|nr:hypothetical protein [Acinetobacter sp. RIT698]